MGTWLGNNWIPSKGVEFWHLKDQIIWLGRSWAPPLFHLSQLLKGSPGQFGVSPLWERSCWEGQWKGQEVQSRGRKGAHGRLSIRKIWLPTAKHPVRLPLRRSGPVVPTHWATELRGATMECRNGKQELSVICVCVPVKNTQHSSPGEKYPFLWCYVITPWLGINMPFEWNDNDARAGIWQVLSCLKNKKLATLWNALLFLKFIEYPKETLWTTPLVFMLQMGNSGPERS